MGAWMENKREKWLPNSMEFEEQARHQTINIRDASIGGRIQGGESYHRCHGNQQIFGLCCF